jgi:putative sigma-54 modulation protein
MAQMVVKGKNIEVTEPLHDYVEKKLGKLDKHLDKITATTVELSTEPHKSNSQRQVVQVTMQVNGQILRAENADADMYAAVDGVVEKLERSMERYKSKRYRKDDIRKNRREAERSASANEAALAQAQLDEEDLITGITHVKRFQIKPMSAEEATDQMELLGHDFYIFFNEDTSAVSVVYKRKNGTYGLLLPELA